MLKCNKLIGVALLLLICLGGAAQNNTNSPYTRFGYGNLADRSFGAGRGMGGVGIGLRDPSQINPMNPASYSSMDSLTFLFDFGAGMQFGSFSDGVNSDKKINGNIEYVAFQFPVTRWLALSAGLKPYSFVGYEYGATETIGETSYGSYYTGKGGLNEVYGGLSIDIWRKRLAVGANFGYLFGNITHSQNLQFAGEGQNALTTARSQMMEVRDFKMDFGVQYTHPLSATESMTLGLTYSPANRLNATSYNSFSRYSPSQQETIESSIDTIKGQVSDLAASYGVGLSYRKANRLTVAADFLYETWDKSYYLDQKGKFQNRMRIAAGVEFIPAYNNKLYFNRIKYRAGVHYSNSYLNVNMAEGETNRNYGYNEYGATIGLGFPLIDNRSYVNLGVEYVKVKPEHPSMIDEQYFRISVSYAFNEFWFFKRKVD